MRPNRLGFAAILVLAGLGLASRPASAECYVCSYLPPTYCSYCDSLGGPAGRQNCYEDVRLGCLPYGDPCEGGGGPCPSCPPDQQLKTWWY